MKWPLVNMTRETRGRVLVCLAILFVAFTVRFLTAQFIGQHITDPSWFPGGIYAYFDNHAQNILDGKANAFWAGDALNDERAAAAAVYPPGYSLWLAALYGVSGTRSVFLVQNVQLLLDTLSVLLIVGIGASVYGWRVGVWAGLVAALSPLLAFNGATPLADAPTSWVVLGGAWLLLIAAQRTNWRFALGAGVLIGASLWLRANALLLGGWAALALLLCVQAGWRVRAQLAGALLLGFLLIVSPVIVRNSVAFGAFVPGGMGFGTNLWQGLGEFPRGVQAGAVIGDVLLVERERAELGLAPDAPLGLYWPNGLERDRARMRKALVVIKSNLFWYLGTVVRRMGRTLKYAGTPAPYLGTAGINVTARKCLPQDWQGGVISFAVNLLGMAQSVLRYLLLPLMLCGLWLGWRRARLASMIILTIVLYYLVVGSMLHTELRYGLPMQALLLVFAGLSAQWFGAALSRHFGKQKRQEENTQTAAG